MNALVAKSHGNAKKSKRKSVESLPKIFPANNKLNRRRDANKNFITTVLNPATLSVIACCRIAATELNYD